MASHVQPQRAELELRVDCALADLDDRALLHSFNALLERDSRPATDLRIVPMPAGRCAVRVRSLSIAQAEQSRRKIQARRGLKFGTNGHRAVATRIIRDPDASHRLERRRCQATAPRQERCRFAGGSGRLGGERSESNFDCPARSAGEAALRRSATTSKDSGSLEFDADELASNLGKEASASVVTDNAMSDADEAPDVQLALRLALANVTCGMPLRKDDDRAQLFDTALYQATAEEARPESTNGNAPGRSSGSGSESERDQKADIIRQHAATHLAVDQEHIHVALPHLVEGLSALPHADQLPPGRSAIELDCGTRGRWWPLSALIDLLGAFPSAPEGSNDHLDVAAATRVNGLNKAAIVELHYGFREHAASSAAPGKPRLLSIRGLSLVLAECRCGAHRPQETFFGGAFELSVDKLDPPKQRQSLLRFYPVPTNVLALLRTTGCHAPPSSSTATTNNRLPPASNPLASKHQHSSRAVPCEESCVAADIDLNMPYLTFAELLRVFCTWVDERIALAVARRDAWERMLRAQDDKDGRDRLSGAAESELDSFIGRTRDQLKGLTERLDSTRLQTEALQVLLQPLACDICGADLGEAPEKVWEHLQPMMQNREAFFPDDAAAESEDGSKLWLDTDKVLAQLPARLRRCVECSDESGEPNSQNDEHGREANPIHPDVPTSDRAAVAEVAPALTSSPKLAPVRVDDATTEPASPVDAIVQQAHTALVDMQIYEDEVIAEDAEACLLDVLATALASAGVERDVEARTALRDAFTAACGGAGNMISLALAESALRAAWLQLSTKATV